jgi:hypothetical protein
MPYLAGPNFSLDSAIFLNFHLVDVFRKSPMNKFWIDCYSKSYSMAPMCDKLIKCYAILIPIAQGLDPVLCRRARDQGPVLF